MTQFVTEWDAQAMKPTVKDCTEEVGQTSTTVLAPIWTGAFIRVASSHGVCAQYFSRDAEGRLHSAGPLMVVAP